MENSKFVKIFIPIIILGFFVSGAPRAFAYGVNTHSFLTQETVRFYNQHFPHNQIQGELFDYLIDGTRQEDKSPRWFNHYFDPVHNRGLTFDPAIDPIHPGGPWQSARDWAQDRNNQSKLLYRVPAIIASILTAVQQRKISAISSDTDFTWQRAIEFYVQGEREKAMFALGHILHLLQDLSVPDHTRNDPHPFDSPFELFADRYTLNSPDKNLSKRLQNRQPIILSDLNSYFKELALYSNNNFYSKDTIGIQSGYNLPQPDYFKIGPDNKRYGMKIDLEFGDYFLIKTPNKIFVHQIDKEEMFRGDYVLPSYWYRLSTKSVQYNAGIINLFFEEAERAKNEQRPAEKERTFLGQTIGSIRSFINSIGSAGQEAWLVIRGIPGLEIVEEIDLTRDSVATRDAQKDSSLTRLAAPSLSIDKSEVKPGAKIQIQGARFASQSNLVLYIGRPDGRRIEIQTRSNVRGEFNVAYTVPLGFPAGVYFSYARESASGRISDRVRFRVLAQTQTEEETLAEEESVNQEKPPTEKPAEIEEREQLQSGITNVLCGFQTDQTPNRQSVLINEIAWMGSTIHHNNEWIELKNISGRDLDVSGWQLFDLAEQIKIQFPSGSRIPANGFYLLERTNDESVPYVTADLIYVGVLANNDEGLRLFDKNCNLIDEVLANPSWLAGEATSRRTMERSNNLNWHTSSFIDGTPKQKNSEPLLIFGAGVAAPATPSLEEAQFNQPAKILISEVKITGGDGKTRNDFIEIYNPNNIAVNLRGYRLVDRTRNGVSDSNIKSWTEDVFIPPKSFYLWVNRYYSNLISQADVFNSATIAANNGIAIRFGAANTGQIIDSVAWGIAENIFVETAVFPTNPEANQSIQRKVIDGAFVDTNNNAADFELQNCPSPQIFFAYCPVSILVPKPTNFSAIYHPDLLEIRLAWDNNPSLIYRIKEYNSEGVVVFEGKRNFFNKRINEVGRLYRFSIQALDENGNGSEWLKKEIETPSFIDNFAFYQSPRRSFSGFVNEPVIEFSYDHYPFLPRDLNLALAFGEPPSPNYKVMVFYLNSEAPSDLFLNGENPHSKHFNKILKIKYSTCASGFESYKKSLLLPDIRENCNVNIGGIPNAALDFRRYLEEGDLHLLLPVSRIDGATNFGPNDYLTVAFYGLYRFYPWGYVSPDIFKLLAVDRTKYFFQNEPPLRQPPTPPQKDTQRDNLSFNETKFKLTVNLKPATDPDTLDNFLFYEISYDNGANWQVAGLTNQKIVAPNTLYNIKARTVDDFGTRSENLEISFQSPPVPPRFGLSQIHWRRNAAGEISLSFNYENYPFIAVDLNNQFNAFDAIIFYFNQLPPAQVLGSFWNVDQPSLKISRRSCDGFTISGASLILARSPEFVRSHLSGGISTPINQCVSWDNKVIRSALVPSPEVNQPGRISLTIAGLANLVDGDKKFAELNQNDYFTIGFYNIVDHWGNLVLVASDPNRYYFQIE